MRNPNTLHPYKITVVLALMAIAAILAFATVMTVSAQSNDRDWKQSPTGLNVTAGDAGGKLNITWDAHPQTSKTLSDYRVTWTPDGEAFRPNSETEWYAYPTTNQVSVTGLDAGETYQVRVRARYDDNKKSRWSDVVSGQTGVTTNTPATGQPTITGSAEVGETLTAATSAISDSNGITNAVFSHQWVRSANGSDNDITNATGSTYVITNADVDAAIKVRVSFTDDDGYSETLTSNATTSVPVPAPIIVPPEEPQIAQAAGDDGETLVLDTWSLIPSGLNGGDSFRLLFLSSTTRNGSSSSIGTYNTFVQNRATAGHDGLADYASQFKVVGSTADTDARDNTETTGAGVPIYWVNGNKLADGYSDFYDGSWDDETNIKDESGDNRSSPLLIFTGSGNDGTESFVDSDSRALGKTNVRMGQLGAPGTVNSPLSGNFVAGKNENYPFYGLSPVFTIATPVLNDWSLKPSGLGVGDRFRLIFLSSTKRNGSSTNRADYNSFIQGRAAAGHADILAYSSSFSAVGCTEDTDARDNTGTTYTSTDKGVPIYWLDGARVANQYEDFYDGNWDNETNPKDESGANGPDTDLTTNYPITGCNHNGTEKFVSGNSKALGTTSITVGVLDASNLNYGPLSSNDTAAPSANRPMYGLSPVFTVAAAAHTRVSNNWSLTPSELGARDQFRLLFLSSTKRNATSSDIEDYNTFIQTRAAAGHTDIQAYSNGFKVVGCTADDDAQDNTGTTYTSTDKGVPIYWLDGAKIANEYEDFYDRRWDNTSNTYDRDELGINSTNTDLAANRTWSGCNHNGTEAIFGGTSYALGKATPNTGDVAANTPIGSALLSTSTNLRPLYGLSQLFEVPPDPTLGDLVLEGTTNSESISLSPTFDDDTFTYTAAVPTGIDAVRLTATTNDSHSTVAITGDSDASTPNTADFDLDLGANTLSLTVTAEDGTTQTYTITVTQLGTPPPPATVTSNWDLTPDGVSGGQQFRLIFYSSTKRDAESDDIEDYNTFVQDRAAAGHAKIRQYSDGFTAIGCTEDADARDNTQTRYTDSNTGVPIYWLSGLKVADNYRDFYDGSWDQEANDQDRNEVGNTGPDSSQAINYPWTGCDHDGTEAFLASGDSVALGNTNVRMGKPGSTVGTDGPLNGDQEENRADTLPMYGLSQVFTVLPGNTGTLTTGGTPRSDTLGSSDTGHYWQVRLHKNVRYQIDVKGSERSQPGGTITNPWLKLIAGSDRIELLNGSSAGVSQTGTGTEATGGGAGQNSRLDIKVIEATDGGQYYHLLVHRADGDDGSYTVTVTRLDWPDGRRAPDITVVQENRNNVEISWTKSKKTHSSLVSPEGDYKIEYRRLSDTNWTSSGIVDKSDPAETISSLAANTTYEVRVRMIPPAGSTQTYRWGYARVYTTN